MAITIEANELEVEELVQMGRNLGVETNQLIAGSPRSGGALLGSKPAGLNCITALCECYQELLLLSDAVQMLYNTELDVTSSAVKAIMEADRAAARDIDQA